jgi:capsular polysaccharide biosynthesis protein
MKFILTPPSLDDFIRLLKAWRFWMLGAIFGAMVGAAVYYIVPPPFRAQATVNVDFNLEQAWPKETDRQQFYYLERESRKLKEIAWSDDVMGQLASKFSISVEELRGNKLQLSQPAEAGWHFFATDGKSQIAASLASAWAEVFVAKVQADVKAGNINEFVKLEATQSKNLPKERRISLSVYLLASSIGVLTLAVFGVLFIKPKPESSVS